MANYIYSNEYHTFRWGIQLSFENISTTYIPIANILVTIVVGCVVAIYLKKQERKIVLSDRMVDLYFEISDTVSYIDQMNQRLVQLAARSHILDRLNIPDEIDLEVINPLRKAGKNDQIGFVDFSNYEFKKQSVMDSFLALDRATSKLSFIIGKKDTEVYLKDLSAGWEKFIYIESSKYGIVYSEELNTLIDSSNVMLELEQALEMYSNNHSTKLETLSRIEEALSYIDYHILKLLWELRKVHTGKSISTIKDYIHYYKI